MSGKWGHLTVNKNIKEEENENSVGAKGCVGFTNCWPNIQIAGPFRSLFQSGDDPGETAADARRLSGVSQARSRMNSIRVSPPIAISAA